jgi:hypothetical protein
MWSSSQAPPPRTVRAVPAQCWVRSVWTEVVRTPTVATLEVLPGRTSALSNVIERTELNVFSNDE